MPLSSIPVSASAMAASMDGFVIRNVLVFIIVCAIKHWAALLGVVSMFVCRYPRVGTAHGAVLICQGYWPSGIASTGGAAVSTALTAATNGEAWFDSCFGFNPTGEGILAVLDNTNVGLAYPYQVITENTPLAGIVAIISRPGLSGGDRRIVDKI